MISFGRALDALIVAGILGASLGLGSTLVDRSRLGTEREALAKQAQELYDALELYRERHGSYPPSFGEEAFELESLEPLRRRGYYTGRLLERVDRGRLDGYEAQGGTEFWLELTAASTPTLRFAVARSDDAPLGGGAWLEGVYVHDGQRLAQR